MRLGADSGGTFTDLVGIDGRILKIPSTPDDPGSAVRSGLAQLSSGEVELLAHGTTVATNAVLERTGGAVALFTTEGFADVIEIARQSRPALYDPWHDRPPPLVGRAHRLEVRERTDPTGSTLIEVDVESIPPVPDGIDSVAVCLLHADLSADHERLVADALRRAGWDVSASHEVAPEFREYERTVTTVVNAYLRPVCRPYLEGLAGTAATVVVMTSAGGLVDLDAAAATPAALLLSGPAGGVRAAAAVARACGRPDAISFDMGGTSTDVCLILGGEPAPAAAREIDGLPVRLPSLDVHTIGAGGGSIARIDAGGALRVGPESAGAVPGPACYGRGGEHPTVTDADLVLGRIPVDTAFSGLGSMDLVAARAALDAAGVDAAGVIDVVNAQMEQAVRTVSVERGVDPSTLALIAFGGAGPLHACDLADAAGIPEVIVPGAAGVLSAVGLLTSPSRRELVQSWPTPSNHEGLQAALAELADRAARLLGADVAEIATDTAVDCRYRGQSHELRVASVADFPAAHMAHNGYVPDGTQIEVVALRAVAEAPPPATVEQVLARWSDLAPATVEGPDVVVREDCTIWVPAGWRGVGGPFGSLVLTRVGAST